MPLSLTAISANSASVNRQGGQDHAFALVFPQRVNAFRSILQHVCERLRHQPAIKIGQNSLVGKPVLESNVRAPDPHQKYRLAHAVGKVVVRRPRLGHAREGGEFVDHPFDVVDLPDDGVRALVENFPALENMPTVTSLQALGRELDRRQRIPDLVRDATRHVRPSGGALGGDQVADVVERDDAGAIVAPGVSGDPNVQNPLATVSQDGRLPLMEPQPQRSRLFPDQADAGLDGVQGPTDQTEIAAEQALRGGVRNRDDAFVVDAQNAGGHARQHRLDEGSPLIVERVRLDQAGLLAQQLGGHLVEGVSEMPEIPVGACWSAPGREGCRKRPRRSPE